MAGNRHVLKGDLGFFRHPLVAPDSQLLSKKNLLCAAAIIQAMDNAKSAKRKSIGSGGMRSGSRRALAEKLRQGENAEYVG